jgi:hypothetical protein
MSNPQSIHAISSATCGADSISDHNPRARARGLEFGHFPLDSESPIA